MISVIIPLYNKEKAIERTLRSVFSQDFDDYEIIIVDDGSTDKSVEIVENLLKLLKPLKPLKLLSQLNGGPSKARNTGVQHATGEWILFLDADDELLPGALKMYAEAKEKHKNCDFIDYSYYNNNVKEKTLADQRKEGYVSKPFRDYFYNKINPRTGSFICKRTIALTCLFNEEIRRFEDDEMMFRLFNKSKMYYIPEPIMSVNCEYSAASHGRINIDEDFLGHLDFKGKTFWEKMCLYRLFLGERPNYPEQCRKMYPTLYWRYDLFLIYKLLQKIKL